MGCGRGSAQGMETAAGQGIFPVFRGLVQGISGNPLGSFAVPAAPDPSQAAPSSAGLLPPALANTQLLLGKLAKHRETRKAMPLTREHSGQLLTLASLCRADLSSLRSWGSFSFPQHFCGQLFLETSWSHLQSCLRLLTFIELLLGADGFSCANLSPAPVYAFPSMGFVFAPVRGEG